MKTDRLELRRPTPEDVPGIFERFASDPEVTRYVGWPRHRSTLDTEAFVAWSDSEWDRAGRGPLLLFDAGSDRLLGSAGLAVETPYRASTGYVLARDAWGRGLATETLGAMVEDARDFGIRRLYALCHTGHRGSWRVLEKQGFEREAVLRSYQVFPNLQDDPGPTDVLCYARILGAG